MEIITPIDNFKGEIAALTAAFFWASSSIVYGILGQTIAPLKLNFFKGIIAIALILFTLIISSRSIPAINSLPLVFLLLSGVIGIGLGDTAYFSALNKIGARRTLLIETLAPPIAALLALIFLGEELKLTAWCGILLTIIGVAWVITERTSATVISASSLGSGIVWGILAAIAEATGAVLSRFALVESKISPLWSTLLRLIGGTIIVLILLLLPRKTQEEQKKRTNSQLLKLIGAIAITAFGSTYLGIWLQQTSLKFAPTGIAQTLFATSPLFVLPIAALMGDRISFRAVFGVLVAVAGIGLLFAGR